MSYLDWRGRTQSARDFAHLRWVRLIRLVEAMTSRIRGTFRKVPNGTIFVKAVLCTAPSHPLGKQTKGGVTTLRLDRFPC